MMLKSDAILEEIKALRIHREDLDDQIDTLVEDYSYEKMKERQGEKQAALIRRFETGEYIVAGIKERLWWVSAGELIEHVTADEASALFDLERDGIVKKCEKRAKK